MSAAGNRVKKLQARKQGNTTTPVRYNQPVGFVSSGIVDPYQVEHTVIQPALGGLGADAPDLASMPQLHDSAMAPQLLHGMSPAEEPMDRWQLPDVMEEEPRPGGWSCDQECIQQVSVASGRKKKACTAWCGQTLGAYTAWRMLTVMLAVG